MINFDKTNGLVKFQNPPSYNVLYSLFFTHLLFKSFIISSGQSFTKILKESKEISIRKYFFKFNPNHFLNPKSNGRFRDFVRLGVPEPLSLCL